MYNSYSYFQFIFIKSMAIFNIILVFKQIHFQLFSLNINYYYIYIFRLFKINCRGSLSTLQKLVNNFSRKKCTLIGVVFN